MTGEKRITALALSLLLALISFACSNPSGVTSAEDPVASPPPGPVARGTAVSLHSTTPDAEIWYTTNGNIPSKAVTGVQYKGPITITGTTKITAVAFKDGMNSSNVVVAKYEVLGSSGGGGGGGGSGGGGGGYTGGGGGSGGGSGNGGGVQLAYTTTVQSDGNGSAAASPNSAYAGITVTVHATPNPGFKFKEWHAVSGGVKLSSMTANPSDFSMPSNNVTIEARFEKATGPALILAPSPISISAMVGYKPAAHARKVTKSNTGLAPANVTSIVLSGTNASAFKVSAKLPATISPGGGAETFTVEPSGSFAVGTYTAVIKATYDGGETAVTNINLVVSPFKIDMVRIPPVGDPTPFTMGGDGLFDGDFLFSDPKHKVTLTNAYYMGAYPVTQDQYEYVMGVNPSYFQGAAMPPDGTELQGKRPAERVTWYDAIEFCNALSILEGYTPYYTIDKTVGSDRNNYCHPDQDQFRWLVTTVPGANGYRIPTEAQWEYACRAGTTTSWSYGDKESDAYMWYEKNSNGKTHEVGMKKANLWGLYDIHGNVFEWCWDWQGYGMTACYSGNDETDPEGVSFGYLRHLRGGAFFSEPKFTRSACRYALLAGNTLYRGYTGFRIIRP